MKLKQFITITLISTCLSSYAEDTSDRKVTDLILFPNQGEIFTSLNIYSLTSEYEWIYLSSNFLKSENEITGTEISAMYSFTDQWAATISLDYVTSDKTKATYGPATTISGTTSEYESDGLKDPNFSITYRAMDTQDDGYDLNLSIKISPKLQDAKGSTTKTDGNVAKGATNSSVAIEWGKRNGYFSWATSLALTSNGEAESKDVDDGDITKVDSHGTFSISGKFQWQLTERLNLSTGLDISNTGDYRVSYSDGDYFDYESASILSLTIGTDIKLTESLYLNIDLLGAAVGDRTVTDEDNLSVTDTERKIGQFKIGLLAQF